MARTGRVLRLVLAAVALAGFVVACLRLGWWQWQRYHGPGGSLQNLGYMLQWPTFAAFALFMVWRLRRLERQRHQHSDQQPSRPTETPTDPSETTPARPASRVSPTPLTTTTPTTTATTATTTDGEDKAEADELAAYNRYLAQLNAKERHRGH